MKFEEIKSSLEVEDIPNPLENEKMGLEICTSFDELYKKLQAIGEVKGTQKNYSASELIKKIEQVRHGHRDISFITRSYGLQEVVKKLLLTDRVYKKY